MANAAEPAAGSGVGGLSIGAHEKHFTPQLFDHVTVSPEAAQRADFAARITESGSAPSHPSTRRAASGGAGPSVESRPDSSCRNRDFPTKFRRPMPAES